MNQPTSTSGFYHLDEGQELYQQSCCQMELEAVLTELGGLVLITEMPEQARDRLILGLRHLRGHIHAETRQLITEMQGRLN